MADEGGGRVGNVSAMDNIGSYALSREDHRNVSTANNKRQNKQEKTESYYVKKESEHGT